MQVSEMSGRRGDGAQDIRNNCSAAQATRSRSAFCPAAGFARGNAARGVGVRDPVDEDFMGFLMPTGRRSTGLEGRSAGQGSQPRGVISTATPGPSFELVHQTKTVMFTMCV